MHLREKVYTRENTRTFAIYNLTIFHCSLCDWMVDVMNVSSKSEEGNGARDEDDDSLQEVQGEDGTLCSCLISVAGLLFLFSLAMAFVAVFILSIYFLVVDKGEGGECADTYGHHIWVYFLIKLCVGVCSQFVSHGIARSGSGKDDDDDDDDASSDRKAQRLNKETVSGIVLVLLINIGILVYGGVVLVHDPVCVEYTNTGLYKMAYAMFFIDSSMIFCMTCAGLLKCCREDTLVEHFHM